MGGFIILSDGRAWAASNWAYDEAIRCIAQAIPSTPEGKELSKWLLNQTCEVKGAGLGSVDLRELTVRNQQLFIEAVRAAAKENGEGGAEGWNDATFFPAWKDLFEVLPKLIESIEKGEPASMFNPHMRDVIPPTGERSGPGWDEQESA